MSATSSTRVVAARFQPDDLFGMSGIGVALADDTGRLLKVNKHFCELLGRSEDQVLGHGVMEFTAPDDHVITLTAIERLTRLSAPTRYEKRYLRPDGKLVWAQVSITPSHDEQGRVVAVGLVQDITAQREAEARLHANEARLRLLFEQFPAPLSVLEGPDLVFTLANEPYRALLGGREVVGLSVRDILPPGEGDRVLQMLRDVMRSGQPFVGREMPFLLNGPDGTPVTRCYDFLWQPLREADGSVRGIIAGGHDVTASIEARTRLESARQAARQSEDRLRLALDATSLGTWDWDLRTGAITWDLRMRELFGFGPDEPVGLDAALGRMHAQDRDRVLQELQRATAGDDQSLYETEYRVAWDGSERWVHATGRLLLEDGQPARFTGTALDVTHRRQQEAALRRSEAQFRAICECAPIGVFVAGRDGQAAYVNPALSVMLGAPQEAFLGHGWNQLVHPDDRAFAFRSWSAATQAGLDYAESFRWVASDGRVVWGHVRASPVVETAAVSGYVGIVEDITARRQADEMKAEFLNLVAHELRTPLTPIVLQLEALLRRQEDAAEQRRLQVMQRNFERLNGLVAQLLDVARLEHRHAQAFPVHRRPVDMAVVVAEAATTFREAAAAAGVELRVQASADLLVMADTQRLAQVLANLLSNALRCTPRGGSVAISASQQHARVTVTVTDTGCGFEPGEQGRLFQPFSQLRRTHEGGSGLGLYISRTIVEQHGGRIWAESAGPDRGATFSFSLPVADALPASPGAT